MKTGDLIQLGLLGVVAYLAYQKFAAAREGGNIPNPTGPSATHPIQTPNFTAPLLQPIGVDVSAPNPLNLSDDDLSTMLEQIAEGG